METEAKAFGAPLSQSSKNDDGRSAITIVASQAYNTLHISAGGWK